MMWASFTKKLMAFAAFLLSTGVALVMLWIAARKSGKAEANERNAIKEVERAQAQAAQTVANEREANERQIETVQNAKEITEDVAAMPADAVRNELFNNWRRLED